MSSVRKHTSISPPAVISCWLTPFGFSTQPHKLSLLCKCHKCHVALMLLTRHLNEPPSAVLWAYVSVCVCVCASLCINSIDWVTSGEARLLIHYCQSDLMFISCCCTNISLQQHETGRRTSLHLFCMLTSGFAWAARNTWNELFLPGVIIFPVVRFCIVSPTVAWKNRNILTWYKVLVWCTVPLYICRFPVKFVSPSYLIRPRPLVRFRFERFRIRPFVVMLKI